MGIAGRIALVLLLAGAAPAHAQAPASPPAKIADAAWLQGYWEGEGFGGKVEDIWMPPRNGVILGAFRLVKPDGSGFYELFAVEEFEGSLRFVVKHFNPDWVGWEEKDKAISLKLTRISPTLMEFGGVAFEREGSEGLTVRLAIRSKDGQSRHQTLHFKRKPL